MKGTARPRRVGRFPKIALIAGMSVCAVVFVFAAVGLITQFCQYETANRSYEELSQHGPEDMEAESPADAVTESPVDFDALRRINPEVVAWIEIPGTQINYPVAQGDDNQRYLEVTFDGKYNNSGAVFMDFACQKDLMGSIRSSTDTICATARCSRS